jgi:hypothetical protein
MRFSFAFPFRTNETVVVDTPTSLAISFIDTVAILSESKAFLGFALILSHEKSPAMRGF